LGVEKKKSRKKRRVKRKTKGRVKLNRDYYQIILFYPTNKKKVGGKMIGVNALKKID
jgi:hypothetical protein